MIDVLKVAILGATGMAGQWAVRLLSRHPWFEINALAASERSVGKRYASAAHWYIESSMPRDAASMEVVRVDSKPVRESDLIISNLPSEVAMRVEENLVKRGLVVVSTASAHRMEPRVPLINPEINADHLALIDEQKRVEKWDGALVTTPNCTVAILSLSLKPILDNFGIESIFVTTMQSLSGAGFPGVASLEVVDNVLPFIRDEEEKVEEEALKILGALNKPSSIKISATCCRVPVLHGHLESVFVKTSEKVEVKDFVDAFENFVGEPQRLKLPTAPEKPIIVRGEPNRPQPRLDRMAGGGMSVVVGRVRKDEALGGVKYVVLGHNLVRGASGCAVLTAELLKVKGYL